MKTLLKPALHFLFLLACAGLSAIEVHAQELVPVPDQPSLVAVSGRQLLAQRRNGDGSLDPTQPYVIRGVNWSPSGKDTLTSPTDRDNAKKLRLEFGKWYAVDIPLIRAMNVNTVRIFSDFGLPTDPGSTVSGLTILDELYRAGIMVIMTLDPGAEVLCNIGDEVRRAEDIVAYYKNHPAILMWSLGNEWNLNSFYRRSCSQLPGATGYTPESAATIVETMAQTIKALDPNHPVASSYGDIVGLPNDLNFRPNFLIPTSYNISHYVNDVCKSVDLWSINSYRGRTFTNLFNLWRSVSAKPMFVGEFGIDRFKSDATGNDGVEDESTQALWDGDLWDDLARNLSADDPALVALGGTIFSFSDNWWKAGGPSNQDRGRTFPFIAFQDGYSSEDWWGLVDIDRKPKQAYFAMQGGYDLKYQPPPPEKSRTYSAWSRGVEARHWEQWDKWDFPSLLYQGLGGRDYGGRGFNIIAIDPVSGATINPEYVKPDPKTGIVYSQEYVNFDTWGGTGGDPLTMGAMIDFLDRVPSGTILMLAVADEAGLNVFDKCDKWATSNVRNLINALKGLGSSFIDSYCYRDSWSMVAIKGQGSLSENLVSSAVVVTSGVAAISSAKIELKSVAPSINGPDAVRIRIGDPRLELHLTIDDVDTPVASLLVSAASQSPTIIPNDSLILPIGRGHDRILLIDPAQLRAGNAFVTVSVSDGTTSVAKDIAFAVDAVVPGAPIIVAARTGDETVTIDFRAPQQAGGIPILAYRAICESSDGGRTAEANVSDPAATSITVGPLDSEKHYSCAVMAINSAGIGLPSPRTGPLIPRIDVDPIILLLFGDD